MARPSASARILDIGKHRQQVMSQFWAQDLNVEETQRFLANLPPRRFPSVAFAEQRDRPLIQPRGGVPVFDAQHSLTRLLDEAGADFIPLTVDSYTRQNRYDVANQLLKRSEEEDKHYLNGYPLIAHGHIVTRDLYDGLNKPISLRHGTPDARLLTEVALASGIVEIEGGGICYCLPYSEGFPLDRCLLYWQYVDRICAIHSSPSAPVHRESFGPLTATLVPPAIAIVVQILEALLAAEQGVISFSVSFSQTGSPIQDIATAHVLRRLTRKYLDEYGFEDLAIFLVYHQWMGQFPTGAVEAAALITGSTQIAAVIGADKIVVKTVDEALGIPDPKSNADAVRAVRYVLDRFRWADLITSKTIGEEEDLITAEVNSILETIFELPGGSLWESVFQAFQFGYIDVPFSPHVDNANRLITVRDQHGSIRIKDRGNLPISEEDAKRELYACGDCATEETYRRLLTDINIMS